MTIQTVICTNADDTASLAQRFASVAKLGDSFLLEGQIGAGKTHFARAFIQALLTEEEDIPSPTFTLVQTYDGPDCEIWHADLYRLTSVEESAELGLDEAFETAICLVEWPDRLGDYAPKNAVTISFSVEDDETRKVSFSAPGDRGATLWDRLKNVL